jgi:fermentation-respiration switch protein FrsA (DUF1100 family)
LESDLADETPNPVEPAGPPSPGKSDRLTPPAPAKPRWRRISESAARILLGTIILLFILVRVLESRFLYVPTKFPEGDWDWPASMGDACKDVFLDTSDGVRLHGWFLRAVAEPEASSARITILYFHGNAGNVSDRWPWLRPLSRLPADVFAIDYRGYGRSEGSPSEKGLYLDAEAAYRYLTETRGVHPSQIVVYGRSLGGGPACEIASRFRCAGLVLQSTFTSAPEMSSGVVPIIPLGWAMSAKFDNEDKLPRVEVPLLIIHSRSDQVVPYHMGERLFAAANEPKEFVRLEYSLHSDLANPEEARVFERLGQFLKRIAP